MDNKNGHWYTDKNGNHYFVENGQTPKEGWEQSKRRKMISGGKYQIDDGDGKGPREVAKDEYDKYEADLADFDLNQEDDFGFDEKGDSEYYDDVIAEMRENGVDIGDKKAVMDELSSNYNMDGEERKAFMEYAFGGFDENADGSKSQSGDVMAKFAEWKEAAYAENQDDETVDRSNKLGEELWDMAYGDMTADQRKRFEDEWYGNADPDELESILRESIEGKSEYDADVSDEEINEALGDYQIQITSETTVGDYAKDVAERLGCSKKRVLDVIRSDDPSISEDDLMSYVAGLEDEDEYDFEDEVGEIVNRLKNESGMYYDVRSFAEQKLKDYSPKAREEALKRFADLGKSAKGSDEDERLRRIVDERVKQGWDQKGTHDAQSIKDTGYLGFGSLDALEKATFDKKAEDKIMSDQKKSIEKRLGSKIEPTEEKIGSYYVFKTKDGEYVKMDAKGRIELFNKDEGAAQSFKKGDRWTFDDGSTISVENVAGEKVEISTPSGVQWVTKDELADMTKNLIKGVDNETRLGGKPKRYKPKFEAEDFGDARYYKNNSGYGYHDIASAHGISDEESYRKDFKNRFKHVGQTKDGADIYQGPDGYFSTNPLITSMSFKTKEALQDYEDKRTTDYAYGGYNRDNPNISAPEAYAAARRKAIRAAEDKDVSNRKINHIMEYFDIWGKPSEREFDDVIKHYGLNDSESKELRKKLFGKK